VVGIVRVSRSDERARVNDEHESGGAAKFSDGFTDNNAPSMHGVDIAYWSYSAGLTDTTPPTTNAFVGDPVSHDS